MLNTSQIEELRKQLTSNRANSIERLVSKGIASDAKEASEMVDHLLTSTPPASGRLELQGGESDGLRAGAVTSFMANNIHIKAGWGFWESVFMSIID